MGILRVLVIGAATIYTLYRLATGDYESRDSPPGRPEERQQQQQQQKKKRHVFDEDDDARRKEQAEARLQQQYRTTTTSVYPDTSTLAGNRRSSTQVPLNQQPKLSTQQTSINQPTHTYHSPATRTGVSQEHISRQTQRTQVLRPRPSRTDYSIPPNFNESETYRGVEETTRPSVLYKPRRTSILEEDDTDATQCIDTGDKLRAGARIERESMMQCRKEAKDASRRGDYVVANKLNLKAQMHEGNMERLNSRASEIIYKENNRGRMLGLIDLHGLYVREALERTAEAIEAAQGRGDVSIKIIVGKGNRSRDAIAKLKPEVQAWLSRHNFPAKLDAPGGMFIVDLRGQVVDEHLHEIVYDQTSDDGCDEMF